MAELSIVIVNYNVKDFLEQALLSLREAAENISVEIWVVDNHSWDGSVEFIKERFPEVNVIANDKNFGFARASNQALSLCTGKYILLMNPDVIVQKDTLES